MVSYLAMITAVVLLGADQLIKYWAIESLQAVGTIPLIPGALHLTYRENTGAAFSILNEHTWLLIVITSAVMLFLLYLVVAKKFTAPLMTWGLCLIISGGLGNLIDRLFRGFVVDYVDFRLINFAVFNLADCCVVIGTGLVLLYFLFFEGKKSKETKQEQTN